MNNNAKKWVEALRSGKYKQGKGVLHESNNTYCCLGVACELAVKEGVIDPPFKKIINIVHRQNVEAYAYGKTKNTDELIIATPQGATLLLETGYNTGALPASVSEWLGLNSNFGSYDINTLTGLNDTGKSFEEIADIIESEPEGLFNV